MEITEIKNNSVEKRSRNFAMDLARTIATLYIVGYLHLKGYQAQTFAMPHFMGEMYVTKIVLGLFMFISGFFMAKYSFHTKTDFMEFYKKRTLRFYVLFCVAAIALFIVGYISNPLKLLFTITGISPFVVQPGTLWFMTLLMLFYLLTPILLRKDSNASILIHGLLIYSATFVLSLVLTKVYSTVGGGGKFDMRFFAYFPTFLAGIMVARNKELMQLVFKSHYGLVCLLLLFLIIMKVPENGEFSLTDICVIPLGIIVSLYLSKALSNIVAKSVITARFINFISYCSLCAYLFHRGIYICMQRFFNNFDLEAPYIVLFVTFLPLCCIIAYGIQYSYDRYLLSRLNDFFINKDKKCG